MKKFVCYILACALLVLALVSCGGDGGNGKDAFALDGKTLTFAYAQDGTKIVACSSANAALYEDAKVMDYTLTADGGKLTFTGAEGTSEGEYAVYKTDDKYIVYRISVGGESGYASLTLKAHDDGTKEYLLLVTIMERHVQFTTGKITG